MAAAGDPRGYYRALGVSRTASAEDIRAAFRLRAKKLHPDGAGGRGDREAFRLLLEAYEALRDPQHRLRYDAESLAADRGGQAGAASAPAPGGEPSPWRWPGGFRPDAAAGWDGLTAFAAARAVPLLLAAALVAVAGLAAIGWSRASDRARVVAELSHELRVARARAELVADGADPPRVYRSDFRFPAGVAELDAGARVRLAAVTAELRRVIGTLPEGSGWLVAVEGVIKRAADGDGLLVDAWELALLRVGLTVQYLVGHGIPADRVSVRFHAGALAPRGVRAQPHGVALSVLCCAAGQAAGS